MADTRVIDLHDSGWLSVLLDESIATATRQPRPKPVPRRLDLLDHEVSEALWAGGLLLGSTPECADLRTRPAAETAFLGAMRFALTQGAELLLAQASLRNGHRELRWQLASFAAGLAGDFGVAVVLEEAIAQRQLAEEDELRLISSAAETVASRAYLLGNPPGGLPLHAAVTALDARAFVRLAGAQSVRGGSLRRRSDRFVEQLSRAKALFFELLAGVFATSSESDWPRVAARQVRALSLLWHDRHAARAGLRTPRAPADLLRATPLSIRRLLTEQLILAALLARQWSAPVRAYVRDAGTAAGIGERELDVMEARAAAFLLEHQQAVLALSQGSEEPMIEAALNAASESMQEAAEGIGREMREAGELGTTLARMARGESLNPAERVRLREQLIDLAKVVPSLAIVAAPGGTLLLPLILKLLPPTLVPSAFQHRPPRPPVPGKPSA